MITISDAIPIQFWLNGIETFNEKSVCGIEPVCFCQPFECDDEIDLQFSVTPSVVGAAYSLRILDETGAQLHIFTFTKQTLSTSEDIFSLGFIPSYYGICDKQIQFEIVNNDDFVVVTDSATWTQPAAISGDLNFTSKVANVFTKHGMAVSREYSAEQPAILPSGSTPQTLNALISTNVLGGQTIHIQFVFCGPGAVSFVQLDIASSVFNSYPLVFPALSGASTTFAIIAFCSGGSGSDVDIQLLAGQSIYIPEDSVVAQSDCLDIKTSHDCTNLIQYSNSNDFDDINYTDSGSPNRIFGIRIPSVFFHYDNPEEYESLDLSTSQIVQLVSEVKQKKMLDIGYIPDYLWQKLALIFAHDYILIDSENWIKQDAVQKNQSRKTYPLKKGTQLLTNKDFIKRNVL